MVVKVDDELDVLVVGAGFAGLYHLHHLRKLGYKVKVLEEAPALGGVWYSTSYPGARVDSEIPIYGYSDKEIWEGWNYTERYPARDEILAYFKYVDQKWDLTKDVYFKTRVVSAEFDARASKWHVKTQDAQTFVAKFLVLCLGIAAAPYEAPFQGIDDFKGFVHHSNNWPQEVDLSGKKVAVIGTGATGVQLIQAIGPKVGHLTVFQRTPNLALPMHNPTYTKEEISVQKKEKFAEHFKLRLEGFGGFPYDRNPKKACEESPEVRQEYYEKIWAYGDFHVWLSGYADGVTDEGVNAELYDFWCKKVRARLNNPEMRDKLAPLKPPHAFGTKRPSLERTYYEVYNQPNVDLVDIKANPIDRVTQTGIRTKDGVTHELDVIVLATGFDIGSGVLNRIDIRGSDGTSLKDKWSNGVRTHLGMTSAGFPNMFFLYNAHAPTAFSNGPTCIEVQGDWVIRCIDKVSKSGMSSIDATEQAEALYTEKVHKLYASTLFVNTDGWYNNSNIPGKKKEAVSYIGGIPMYIQDCKASEERGYEGFELSIAKTGDAK